MTVKKAQLGEILEQLETQKGETREKREVVEHVKETLSILDDLERGKITRQEATKRYNRIGIK